MNMNMNMKNIFTNKIVVIVIVVILLIGIGLSISLIVHKNKDLKHKEVEVIINTNKEITKGIVLDKITIKDVELKIKNGLSTYKAIGINHTKNEVYIYGISIKFYNNEKVLGEIEINLDKKIKPNEKVDLVNYSDMDFTKANKVEYKIKDRVD